ncbi:hypothetical protein PR202_ga03855 [Eleusine coracana subsp. coracana]|uniref:Amino acid transporter transmembrane domain-containing protein n=1 Tax=Eleusine coracana subsp. coracana TaxID=191504 RepID=A0AAV5BQ61_ELECO|nr:hypothetical protein PR202_ga03855 [Eleusine coracana subsp. coracana]
MGPLQNGTKSMVVAPMEVSLESGNADQADYLDDDGRTRRTGTIWTASSHIITAVIGSGVLSLAWAIAQLGWVAGPTADAPLRLRDLLHGHRFLAECYPEPATRKPGKRNYTYMDAVRSNLGGVQGHVLRSHPRRVPRFSTKWVCLKMLSVGCLVVSIAAAAGSVADIMGALKVYRPFSG